MTSRDRTPARLRRDPESGFTLIEALVAMAILAVGAVSLLTATESHSTRIGQVTDRAAARWAADARLTELRLGLTPPENPVECLGRSWDVKAESAPTDDPDLARVTVTVSSASGGSPLVTLTGYLEATAAEAG